MENLILFLFGKVRHFSQRFSEKGLRFII